MTDEQLYIRNPAVAVTEIDAETFLVDLSGRILVATRGMPALDGDVARRLVQVGANDRGFLDIRKAPSGDLIAGFSLPVHAYRHRTMLPGPSVASSEYGASGTGSFPC